MDLTILGDNTPRTEYLDLSMLDDIPSSGITQNASIIKNYFGTPPRKSSPTTPPPEDDGWDTCVNSTYDLGYCEEYCPDCEARGAIYAEKSEGTLVDIIHSVLSHLMLVSPAPKKLIRYPEEFESEIEEGNIIEADIITEVRNNKALPAVSNKPNDFNAWQQKQLQHEREMLELELQEIALEKEKLGYRAYQEKLEKKAIEEISEDINNKFQLELKRRGA